jgi:hypothetical protein
LGKLRRKQDWEGAREAKRNQRREIRRAKKKCWNSFLQNAEGKEVWTAASYTAPRLDKSGHTLKDANGEVAEGHEAREEVLMAAHFPPAPAEPECDIPGGGDSFRRVDRGVVGFLLRKAGSSSAPGEDRISAGILKVFWEWAAEHMTALVRGCIRLGHHPQMWKTAKGIVIPKAGKSDYSQVRSYRVIALLDVMGKLVERTAAHLLNDHLE